MAVADDPTIEHGPLELLFTVSEEQGLDGAKALDASLVSGRLLLNLDGTSDDALTIGSAGSDHTHLRIQLHPEPPLSDHVARRVEVSGARGGHSGGDIALGRANAIKVLGRVLASAPVRLGPIEGGVSRNALPRSAHAVVAVGRGSREGLAIRSGERARHDRPRVHRYATTRSSSRWSPRSSKHSHRPTRRGACSIC